MAAILKPGLYDNFLTDSLTLALKGLHDRGLTPIYGKVEKPLMPEYLTRFLAAHLATAFRSIESQGAQGQVALANSILDTVLKSDESLAYLVQERLAI